jgi:adenylate cyclase
MTYDIAALRSPEDVRALFRLNASVDALVEEAQRRRWALSRAMESILPAVATMLSARAFAIRTYGEDLELHDYGRPDAWGDAGLAAQVLAALDAHTAEAEGESTLSERAGRVCVSQRLDVAGEWFGAACLVWESDVEANGEPRDRAFLTAALEVVCEELDGFLFGIRAAREKHRVMMALAHALQSPVLGEGLADAARVLFGAAPVSKLLLAVLAEDSPDAPVHLQVYDETGCTLDRIGQPTGEASLLDEASAYLFSGDDALLERLGFRGAREEVLINGVSGKALVGKVLVVSPSEDWGTHDRELLAGFADFIRQRVVDFSKEYKVLARSFRPSDVNRLLGTRDYHERWLSPREANVAMLYADIAGFTRLCETVLGDPSRIGALVDAWGHDAVELVWRHRPLRPALLRRERPRPRGERARGGPGHPRDDGGVRGAGRLRGARGAWLRCLDRRELRAVVRRPVRTERQLYRLFLGDEQHREAPSAGEERRNSRDGERSSPRRRRPPVLVRGAATRSRQERCPTARFPRARLVTSSGG